MSLTCILDFRFKSDKADEALALLKDTLKDTRAFQGNQRVDVLQDQADPAHVLLFEVWESRENDTAYREWRAGDGAVQGMADLIAEPPTLVYLDERTDI